MILSDETIASYIDSGKIRILPEVKEVNIRPTGVRVHLGEELLVPVPGQLVDLGSYNDISYKKERIGQEGFVLKRDDFVLASTVETIMTDRDIICSIEGRSTLARLGLMIHCQSGVMDNIHDNPRAITLELKNIGKFDLLLRQHIPVAMLVFIVLSNTIRQDSQSQYQGQLNVTPPNLSFKQEEKSKWRMPKSS